MRAWAFAVDGASAHARVRTRTGRRSRSSRRSPWSLVGVRSPSPPRPPRRRRRPSASCIYTGTTGFRHADAINDGRPAVQTALEGARLRRSTGRTATTTAAARQLRQPEQEPAHLHRREPRALRRDRPSERVRHLERRRPPGPAVGRRPRRRDHPASSRTAAASPANHNATDMGAGIVTWDWWDGGNGNSAVGTTMNGHGATNQDNVAPGPGRRPQPPRRRATCPTQYGFGDEHYNFARNVRGTHHVLATLDERTYTPGATPMGQDHPITWCKLYDGDNVDDGTGDAEELQRRPRLDHRRWATSAPPTPRTAATTTSSSTIVGGVRWVAGEGRKSDCSGTVWSNFTRTVARRRRQRPDRHRRRRGRQGLLDRDRHPIQGSPVRGLREDARPDGPGRQQDDGRHDPDARRPRQLRGRRARHERSSPAST